MNLRAPFIVAVLGAMALASSPASADLFIWVGSNGGNNGGLGCTGTVTAPNACVVGNGSLNDSGTYTHGTNKWGFNISLNGQDVETAPVFFDDLNSEFKGTGSATFWVTETNLSYGAAVKILSTFDQLAATNIDETRYLYIDTTDSGNTSTLLGCVTNDGTAGCKTDTPHTTIASGTIPLSGDFSLTEEIVVASTSSTKGSLTTEDQASTIPEPVSLSLFGTGLVALGALSRRRRKSAKSA